MDEVLVSVVVAGVHEAGIVVGHLPDPPVAVICVVKSFVQVQKYPGVAGSWEIPQAGEAVAAIFHIKIRIGHEKETSGVLHLGFAEQVRPGRAVAVAEAFKGISHEIKTENVIGIGYNYQVSMS